MAPDASDLRRELAALQERNIRLTATLHEARAQIVAMKEEIDRLAQPPSGYGVFLESFDDGTVDIFTGGRKLRVAVSPEVEPDELQRGREVMLNEAMNVVRVMGFEQVGEVVMFKELLADGERALVIGHTDDERIVRLAETLRDVQIRAGDSLMLEPRSGYVFEKIPKAEVEELVLEEVPDIDYASIGGLAGQIELIRDAVELPYLHQDLFEEHELRPPKGILLYGPPGCGKTLIAKAVANSLAKKVAEVTGRPEGKSFFLNIKGPELLNKYVGETERHIRLVFQTGPREGQRGRPGHRLLRRDGLALPHPRLRRQLRRREHDRPAAAQRDRRRRGSRERHRHRRLEPRGHDRPGDPAPRPARREDQDRASGRRGGPRHLQQVPARRRCRCTPTTSPSTAATARRPQRR